MKVEGCDNGYVTMLLPADVSTHAWKQTLLHKLQKC